VSFALKHDIMGSVEVGLRRSFIHSRKWMVGFVSPGRFRSVPQMWSVREPNSNPVCFKSHRWVISFCIHLQGLARISSILHLQIN